MPQSTPTPIAHSPALTAACRPSAGSKAAKDARQVRQDLIDLEARYMDHHGSPARLQLSEEVKLELVDEINSLREVARLFSRAAKAGGEDAFPENLARTVNILGLSFLRLATLMRTHVSLSGNKVNHTTIEMMKNLQQFGEEMIKDYGCSNDLSER